MGLGEMLAGARRAAGLTQAQLAGLAGTSRTTLSAYEHGAKSPTLETAARLLAAAGCELAVLPRQDFVERAVGRGRVLRVPTRLPRLAAGDALASVRLPLHLDWSGSGREYRLTDRADRARVYEIVLREGTPADVLTYVDGALLVDLWDELVLPREIRAAWAPAIEAIRLGRAA